MKIIEVQAAQNTMGCGTGFKKVDFRLLSNRFRSNGGSTNQLVAGFTPEDFGKITEVARSL